MNARRLKAVAAALTWCGILSSCNKPSPPSAPPQPEATPSLTQATATPKPRPPAIPELPRKRLDTVRLYSGIVVHGKVLSESGDLPASATREVDDNYRIDITVHVRLPEPISTLSGLIQADPSFAGSLTDADRLFQDAKVPPAFEKFYQMKVTHLQDRLIRMDELLSRQNFYDCDTILELQHPDTGRRVLLIQSAMDVNTDGSDGDRNVTVDGTSLYFQPQTSYRWPKLTKRPNPFLAPAETKLASLREDYATKVLSPGKKQDLKDAIEDENILAYDLKHYSFLVASADPFIVLPGFMLGHGTTAGPFSPKIGDYAIVCYGGALYPAIVGDAGPSVKVGEASLRICRELDARSSAINRPIDSLKVTYLVFPGSADPAAPPDLEKWRARCDSLLKDIGGSPIELHVWTDIVPPWPTPTPTPSPSPSPSPDQTATPAVSSTPSPSATPTETPTATPSATPSVTPMPSPSPSQSPEEAKETGPQD